MRRRHEKAVAASLLVRSGSSLIVSVILKRKAAHHCAVIRPLYERAVSLARFMINEDDERLDCLTFKFNILQRDAVAKIVGRLRVELFL